MTTLVAPILEVCAEKLFPRVSKTIDLINAVNRQNQLGLALQYRKIREGTAPPMSFSDVEFRAYSQNGEDGILLYIFSLIGVEHRKAVEICAGNGIECNTANLVINHGWESLMIDGDATNVKQGQAFYRRCRDTHAWQPKLVAAWVTAENVNWLIADNGLSGDIDLLSLDLDGVDYWIWRAIEVAKPRVVVVEYNHLWGPEESVTVPYRPDFRSKQGPHSDNYFGASLRAFVSLASEKGYRLVGCQRYGFNAFFVKAGIGEDVLPTVDACECFSHPRTRFARERRLPTVIDREWVRV